MPRNTSSVSPSCDHFALCLNPSTHASKAGYHRPTTRQLAVAVSEKTRKPGSNSKRRRNDGNDDGQDNQDVAPASFPAPLVLPGDDLELDPGCPPQSFQEWLDGEHRNEVTPVKNVVYVAATPEVDDDVKFMHSWSHLQKTHAGSKREPVATPPCVEDVIGYLTAFYNGLPVKPLPFKLRFTGWDSATTSSKAKARSAAAAPRYVGLNTQTECVGIRTRASADKVFPRQLNLDDLLDAAIGMLPEDAYALVMLVDHDLFEDDDDIFVCGRAYGGSRVAVISTARYRPALDREQDVERQHAWPASHCEAYMKECCAEASSSSRSVTQSRKGVLKKKTRDMGSTQSIPHSPDQAITSPLTAAVSAHQVLPSLQGPSQPPPSTATLSGLWLGRVCRCASHELGHCFGIAHCTYYACSMQGSSCLTEDARQPPYLCPVDLMKLLRATGSNAKQRYLALLSFCDQHKETHLFSAFGAWIRARLEEMKPPVPS